MQTGHEALPAELKSLIREYKEALFRLQQDESITLTFDASHYGAEAPVLYTHILPGQKGLWTVELGPVVEKIEYAEFTIDKYMALILRHDSLDTKTLPTNIINPTLNDDFDLMGSGDVIICARNKEGKERLLLSITNGQFNALQETIYVQSTQEGENKLIIIIFGYSRFWE